MSKLAILRAALDFAIDEYREYRWRDAMRTLKAAVERAEKRQPEINLQLRQLEINLSKLGRKE